MKKFLAILASAGMLLSFAACTPKNTDTSSSDVPSEDPEISSEPTKMEWDDVDSDGTIRVACVGDSITAGGTDINYPGFLGEYLTFLGSTDGNTYEVKNFGLGGAAVRHQPDSEGKYFWYDSDQYKGSLDYKADIFIVQMGTNDGAYDNLANADNYFKTDYKNMIQPYIDSGAAVILATPPKATNGIHNDGVNGKITTLVKEIADELSLQLVDMNALTAGKEESFPDGLHGNSSGYSFIAQMYYKTVFGGRLLTATVNTAPGAIVEIGINMATANENGVAKVSIVDYVASRSYPIKISCVDYKPVTDSITINADTSYTYDLTPGSYNVTGNATAEADSEYNATNVASNAVDGDINTRWESGYHDNAWLKVDLGTVKKLNGVSICWEGAYAGEYNIEVSTDGVNFTKVADVTISREGFETTAFDEIDARYIRVNCVKRATKYGSSIKEFHALSDYKE